MSAAYVAYLFFFAPYSHPINIDFLFWFNSLVNFDNNSSLRPVKEHEESL